MTREDIEKSLIEFGYSETAVKAIMDEDIHAAWKTAKATEMAREAVRLRVEQEMKLVRRAFWINILIGGALLFLAMVCLEIVT